MSVSLMRNGLTAENSIFSQKPSIKVSRSKFDLSRLNCLSGDIGTLIPVDLIPTLPNDDFDLSCQYQVDFRPMINPSFTPYKVRIHYYYCRMSDLWQGWDSFISKGRSGNLSLSVPYLYDSESPSSRSWSIGNWKDSSSGFIDARFDGDSSLLSYFTAPRCHSSNNSYLPYTPVGNGVSVGYSDYGPNFSISALPFLMYQKIYRSFYLDPNLMSNGYVESPCWFPDDMDGSLFRIGYDSSNLNHGGLFWPLGTSYVSPSFFNVVPVPRVVGSSAEYYDTFIKLDCLRYVQFADDMFTTALPFLQRGPQTSLDADVSGLSGVIPSGSTFKLSNADDGKLTITSDLDLGVYNYLGLTGVAGSSASMPHSTFSAVNSSAVATGIKGNGFIKSISGTLGNNLTVSSYGSASLNVTAQTLRSLIALSVWQERNALTNGSYQQFIKVHFDNSPNVAYYEPKYIGGVASEFNMSSVMQTSQTASSSGDSPNRNVLGATAGVGSSRQSGNIGHFHSPDFGYIMVLMSIVPIQTYPQETERHWIDLDVSDFFMPEYEQLSYQPIEKRQLAHFNSSSDNDVFGYSNRYVYLKQRNNVCHGYYALPSSVDSYYSSFVQKRIFTSSPSLSPSFVSCSPDNIDRSFLAVPSECAFMIQFYSGVNAVRPLSYVATPNNFGF